MVNMNEHSQGKRLRLQELEYDIGSLPRGSSNSISDVEGVLVGHSTIIKGEGKLEVSVGPIRTGVTLILPHNGNIFREKVQASAFVMNGYGKTIGLVQLMELGNIETPIALTNTLNVPVVADALIDYSIVQNPDIGITTSTVNPVVCECSDGYLNDIQGRHVKKNHVLEAIKNASNKVTEGNVGAGTGMMAFGLKAGVGTASRIIESEDAKYTLGVLVLSNFGRREDLRFLSKKIDLRPENEHNNREKNTGGSIIVVVATDAPLTSRQLNRICKRAPLGISRTGGYASHGSGDIIIGFSTKNTLNHDDKNVKREIEVVNENSKEFQKLLAATVDATEEAILNSLLMAETIDGRDNHEAPSFDINRVKEE